MKKLLVILLALILLLVLMVPLGWWWLSGTSSGANFALNRAAGFVPTLSWQSIDGDLRSGLTVRQLAVAEADTPVTMEQLELAVQIHWFRGPAVEVHHLRARDVRVQLPPGDPDAAERSEPFELPDLTLPVPVDLRELTVDGLEIVLADPQAEAIVIERIELAASAHERLDIEHLQVVLDNHQLDADGHWQLAQPFAGELRLAADLALAPDLRQQLRLDIDGRLANLDIGIDSEGPADLTGQLRLRGLPEMPDSNLRLDGNLGGWPDLPWAARELSLRAEGKPDAWSLRLNTQLDHPEAPENQLTLRARGNLSRVEIEELLAELLDGEIRARGDVQLEPSLAANVALTIDGINPTPLSEQWPSGARLNGELNVETDGERIVLQTLSLSAPPTQLRLSGNGELDPAADRIDLSLDWTNLAWPLLADAGPQIFASERGRVRLQGAISDWQLELEALLQALDQPQSRLDLRASGSDERARIETLSLNAGTAGRLGLDGSVQWAPSLAAQGDLRFEALDPGQFVNELPGQLDGAVRFELDGTDQIDLAITALDGELRGQTVSGEGDVSLRDEQPESGRLTIDFGDNRVTIDSGDGQAWAWTIDAQALHQLWPGLGGQAELSGEFRAADKRIDARGQVSNASFNDILLSTADIDLAMGWDEPSLLRLNLTLNDLDLNPWERIDHLDINLDGSCRGHDYSLVMRGQRANLDLGGRGAWADCLRGGDEWQGELARFYLSSGLAGDWTLNEAMPIRVSPANTEAGPACLRAAGESQGRICLRELSAADQGRLAVGIDAVPMDLLLLPLDPTFHLTTPLFGEIEAAWSDQDGLEDVRGFLRLDPGHLKPLGSDQQLLAIDQVELTLTPDGEQFVLDLNARLEGQSRLEGQARLIDLNDPGSAEIDALMELALPDIGVFNRLVAQLDQLGGRLEAALEIDGPLASPRFEGSAALRDGLITHAPLGLRITDIGLELAANNDTGELTGRMQSGDGHLDLSGRLDREEAGWRHQIEIDGERFSFADVDWLRLTASPSIRLSGQGDRQELDGDIRITHLRGGLPPGSEDRVRSSADVRVMGEDDLDEDDAGGQQLVGRLGIELGDDARLAALGMQTRLAGGLELLWDGDSSMPRGRGVIRLPQGSYRAYGQNLEIRDGEILFTGNPLDNPALDIRAVRDIFGDPQVDEAGVLIRGNAQNPIITLFTDPPTSEEKALAYVVTGADFDHAGGQGAVNVGFYLLPRLFVSYGIGLFEAGNVLSGRFELSRRWGVRVVSGERDTGVDISWALDR
ncbi:MAG: translocation/assembly module TamB domain-containing protein [Wenzhouxiangella sp.]